MQLIKNNSPTNQLGQRLALCVDRVGGKRAMATATLISEAQIFRYLSGETDISAVRLQAFAKAASVDAGWLLTGEGDMVEGIKSDPRPAFRSELMVQATQLFEELLVEFERPFNPRQRARAIAFLYTALRHEEIKRQTEFTPQKFDMLKYVSFLAELRTEEELEILNNSLSILEYSQKDHQLSKEQQDLLRTWCNVIVRGIKGYYSSYPGQVYFERISGGQLDQPVIQDLQKLVNLASTKLGKSSLKWLDLGCGAGRHISHISRHMPNVEVHGLELSQLGFNACQAQINSGKLPVNSVVMGDARELPYANDTYDVIYANLSLHTLPYIPNSGLGLEEALSEVNRTLRSGGFFKMISPYGDWRDYSLPRQFISHDMIHKIAAAYGFEIAECIMENDHGINLQESDSSPLPKNIRLNHQSFLNVTFRKK